MTQAPLQYVFDPFRCILQGRPVKRGVFSPVVVGLGWVEYPILRNQPQDVHYLLNV
jgi:hypothetical protein